MASVVVALDTRRTVTSVEEVEVGVVEVIQRKRKDPYSDSRKNFALSVATEPRATIITPSPAKDAKVLIAFIIQKFT